MNRRVGALALAILGLPTVLAAEIWLASQVERLDGFTADEMDGVIGSGEPLRVTWVGDSTGVGVGTDVPDEALPRLVATDLKRQVDLRVLAVSGATVGDALDTQIPALAATAPQWVFVGIGNNDVTHLTSRKRFRARMDLLLTRVAAIRPEKIIVLGTAEFSGTPLLKQPLRALAGVRTRVLDKIVRELAEKHGATYVPIRELTGRRFKERPGSYHARDDFHPNAAGYSIWAEAIMEILDSERDS